MTQIGKDHSPRSPKELWKEQSMKAQSFDPQMLARRAQGLDEHIRHRNFVEYAAAGAVIAFCLVVSALQAINGVDTLSGAISLAGTLTLAAGSGCVLWQMHSRTGRPRAGAGTPSIISMRTELVRQRDALRNVWKWYLLPFAPGLFLIYGPDLVSPSGNPAVSLILFVGTLGVAIFLCWLNLVAAKRMDSEISRLDAVLKQQD